MRKFYLLFLLLSITFISWSQDTTFIREQKNTSLNANGNELSTKHYVTDNNATGKITARVSFYGGAGYLIDPLNKIISYDYSPYINKLKIGYLYGAEFSVFPKDLIGVGVKYMIFHDNYNYAPLGDEDNFSTTYVGLAISIKRPTPLKPLSFIGSLSLGYLTNSNSGSQTYGPWHADGSSIGGTVDAGLDFRINPHLAIGIDLLVLGGDIKSYILNGTTLKLAKPDNVLRTDLTGGLRFFF